MIFEDVIAEEIVHGFLDHPNDQSKTPEAREREAQRSFASGALARNTPIRDRKRPRGAYPRAYLRTRKA
jgi:hypothetical protein